MLLWQGLLAAAGGPKRSSNKSKTTTIDGEVQKDPASGDWLIDSRSRDPAVKPLWVHKLMQKKRAKICPAGPLVSISTHFSWLVLA